MSNRIYHGTLVRKSSLARLRAYKHSELGGSGVSFSRRHNIALGHSGMYGSMVAADCSDLRLYELPADEQLFRRRRDGRALSTLYKEGYDGIDFAHSVEALNLYDEARALPIGSKFRGFRIYSRAGVPFVEHEVWIFKDSLAMLASAELEAVA